MDKNKILVPLLLLLCCTFVALFLPFGQQDNRPPTNDGPMALYPAFVYEGQQQNWGFIDRAGNWVVEPVYYTAVVYEEQGFYVAEDRNGLYHSFDASGQEITAMPDGNRIELGAGFYTVSQGDGKYTLYNAEGQALLKEKGAFMPVSGDAILYYDAEKDLRRGWSFIDLEGKPIGVPGQNSFYTATSFAGDLALVKMDPKDPYCFMDKNGHVGVSVKPEIQAAAAGADRQFTACVDSWDTKNWGLLDENGQWVLAPKYAAITYLGAEVYAVLEEFNGYYALFDAKGRQLTAFDFKTLGTVHDGLLAATTEKESSLLTTGGVWASGFPIFYPNNEIAFVGDLIAVSNQMDCAYYTTGGQKVFASNQNYLLKEGLTLSWEWMMENDAYVIACPVLSGPLLAEKAAAINSQLRGLFMQNAKDGINIRKYTVQTWLDARVYGPSLLILEQVGYAYVTPEAELGDYIQEKHFYYHIGLEDGVLYQLEDLFQADSDWQTVFLSTARNLWQNKWQYFQTIGATDFFQEIQEKLRGSWADLKPVWSASADGILLEFSDRFGNEGSLLVPFADLDNVVNMASPFYIYLQMATL